MSDRSHCYPALLDAWPLPKDVDGRGRLFDRLAREEIERTWKLHTDAELVRLGVVKFWEFAAAAVDLESMSAHELMRLRVCPTPAAAPIS